MKNRLKMLFSNAMNRNRSKTDSEEAISSYKPPAFKELSEPSAFVTREYKDYNEYIVHQASKLHKLRDKIIDYDVELEKYIQARFEGSCLRSKSVLCLAARLGGEVRGFSNCGALAIGIDLNPGGASKFVLQGDFHSLQFPDEVFDLVFSNSIDHSIDPNNMIAEASRVLKPSGHLILDVSMVKPGNYEALDIRNGIDLVVSSCENSGLIHVSDTEIDYKTNFVKWKGKSLMFKKSTMTRLRP
jgi:SAM-dependent methyltransferase